MSRADHIDDLLAEAEASRSPFHERFGVSWKLKPKSETQYECQKESTGSLEDERLDAERKRELRKIDLVYAIAKKLPRAPTKGDGVELVRGQGCFIGGWDLLLREGILLPMLEWASHHVRGLSPEKEKPFFARYDDELEALRAYHAGTRKLVSATGKAAERARVGIVDLSGGRVSEGGPEFDPWKKAVGEALAALSQAEREMLFLTYVEVDGVRMTVERGKRKQRGVIRRRSAMEEGDVLVGDPLSRRSAVQVAKEVRADEGPMPFGSELTRHANVTAGLLVAEQLGLLFEGSSTRLVDEARQHAIADDIREQTSAARAKLKARLEATSLDVFPPHVIPPPDRAELDRRANRRSAKVSVECCGGWAIVEGARSLCWTTPISGPAEVHPSASWERCAHCSRPRLPARKKRA